MKKLITLFSIFILLTTSVSCTKGQKNRSHLHTSKIDGQISVLFNGKSDLSITYQENITNFNLKIFHKDLNTKKLIYESSDKIKSLNLDHITSELREGLLFAVISGKLNGRRVSNTDNYIINQQEEINNEKNKLKKRSLRYEPR